ncbi:hypothetical protein PGTUg99_021447 [Puccinia graminis f. sp. tritici]|uniref:Secreted protein n=1 Tax=Puccinia graminis f. sp. tritici TaxID=56615 RepID=A0A5B0RLK0_PUCGR|nr:hypothetical protein PGTUg99_021447 [Puccinia graminis f. sp. tritici]
MTTWKIILGFLVVFMPAYVTPGSCIKCLTCNSNASEIMTVALYNKEGKCGNPLPGGKFCEVQRIKKFYRCGSTECGAITVKNKKRWGDEPADCGHENRKIFQKGKIPPSGASSSQPVVPSVESSSEPVVESEEIPGTNGLRYFHFFKR